MMLSENTRIFGSSHILLFVGIKPFIQDEKKKGCPRPAPKPTLLSQHLNGRTFSRARAIPASGQDGSAWLKATVLHQAATPVPGRAKCTGHQALVIKNQPFLSFLKHKIPDMHQNKEGQGCPSRQHTCLYEGGEQEKK